MRTVDRITIRAPLERVFGVASDVERWPTFLPHYRWVRVVDRIGDRKRVEMAAWRPFGPLKYPTWWVSDMWVLPAPAVRYRHIGGITRGMDVEWQFRPEAEGVAVTIVHEWRGPAWPVIGPKAATWVIGPVFIHGIASRTLAGVKGYVEEARGA